MNYLNISKILTSRINDGLYDGIGETFVDSAGAKGDFEGLEENTELIRSLIRDGSIDSEREFTLSDITDKVVGSLRTNALRTIGLDIAVIMLNKKLLVESAALLIGHVKKFGGDENNLSLLSRCLYEMTLDGDKYSKEEVEELLFAAKWGFEKVLEIMPSYNDANYYLGFIYHSLGNSGKAKKHWESSIANSKDLEFKREMIEHLNGIDAKERFNTGSRLAELGLFDEALVELIPAYDLYSDWWELSLIIGKIYRYKDMLPEAIMYLKKALEFNTGCVDALNELGIIFASMGNLALAEEYLNEAIKLEPNNPKLITNLAACNFYAGNKSKAREMIEDITKRFPDDEVAARWSMVLDVDKGNPIN